MVHNSAFFFANKEPHEKSFMQNMANITPKSNGTYLIRISCGTDAAGEKISKTRSELLVMNGFLVYGVIISKA